MRDEGSLALVDGIVHVHPTLTDLHVLEAGLYTEAQQERERKERGEG